MTPNFPRPIGWQGVVTVFGDPLPYVNMPNVWEQRMMATEPLPISLIYAVDPNIRITHIRGHRRIVTHLVDTLMACLNIGIAPEHMKFGGCYAWRMKRTNANKLSLHTLGIAIDLEPQENPQGDVTPELDSRIVTVFKSYGWFWGGDFQGEMDPMHFQWAEGV